MAVFVWFSLTELMAGVAEEARMLYPNLLVGKGKVLQIRTSTFLHLCSLLSEDYSGKLPALFLRAWSRATSLALKMFQRSLGDRLAGMIREKFQ